MLACAQWLRPLGRAARTGVAGMLAPVSGTFAAIGQRWQQDGLRRAARWFAVACACLPVLDVVDAYSVVDALLHGLTGGGVAVPPRAWALLAWVIAAACGAGWAIASAAPRGRMRLFAVCAAMHAAYALASDPVGFAWALRLATLVAAACFVLSYAALRELREG
jgi:hypothetical protein